MLTCSFIHAIEFAHTTVRLMWEKWCLFTWLLFMYMCENLVKRLIPLMDRKSIRERKIKKKVNVFFEVISQRITRAMLIRGKYRIFNWKKVPRMSKLFGLMTAERVTCVYYMFLVTWDYRKTQSHWSFDTRELSTKSKWTIIHLHKDSHH